MDVLIPERAASRALSWVLSSVASCVVSGALLSTFGCAQPPQRPGTLPGASTTGDHVTASDEPDFKKRSRKHLELASAYFGGGELNTALDEVKLALAADPNSTQAFDLRGLIYASLGDQRLADESFRRALELGPNDADALQNYGWYLCQRQNYPQADALFAQALTTPQYRSSARTLLTRGVCQARSGQKREAERTLMSAYELDPGNGLAALNLSEVLYQLGDYERARFYIRRVNGVTDNANAQSLWLGARIEHRLGDRVALDEIGRQLHGRFPQSREATNFDLGRFDDE